MVAYPSIWNGTSTISRRTPMQVIRTCKYTMLRRLIWAVVLVTLCAFSVIALADTPPKALLEHVSSHKLVHDKRCNVTFLNLKHVQCMIYYDEARDTTWLVLFDEKLNITHVARNKAGKEELLWCHEKVCV